MSAPRRIGARASAAPRRGSDVEARALAFARGIAGRHAVARAFARPVARRLAARPVPARALHRHEHVHLAALTLTLRLHPALRLGPRAALAPAVAAPRVRRTIAPRSADARAAHVERVLARAVRVECATPAAALAVAGAPRFAPEPRVLRPAPVPAAAEPAAAEVPAREARRVLAPARPTPRSAPPFPALGVPELAQLTDAVIRSLDRRVTAARERRGQA